VNELPGGVRLVSAVKQVAGYCPLCRGQVETRYDHVEMDVLLDTDENREPYRRAAHTRCYERGSFIVEDGLVRGWDCCCCTCPDGGSLSALCRNHGGAHAANGCARHRQPAVLCECGCGWR
jgi:hypothetical protein